MGTQRSSVQKRLKLVFWDPLSCRHLQVSMALALSVFVLFAFTVCDTAISCQNEAGEPVDWFIIYKLPTYKIGEVGSGVDYMYLDPSLETWQLSKFMINTSQGAIGNTLSQLYSKAINKSSSSAYALYNDSPPVLKYLRGYGHTKGVLLFDLYQGFWLSHSIPHFPSFPEMGYLYPSSGKVNGQTALCVSLHYDQFLHITQHLVYLFPRLYNCSVPSAFATKLPQLAQLCAGHRPEALSDKKMDQLVSLQGEMFFTFAKSERFVDDIYTGWVAQVLNVNLLVETWQRQGHDLPSNCSLPNHVMNIKRIRLPGSVPFHSKYDHSKWCISWAYQKHLTCLGDLNREVFQMWRGGGLLCSYNTLIYKAFRQVVDWYIGC
ncbi:deoxyribonuclease-2-beta [Hippocampus comes]|uniref:deoxyribonuclease-2-beta n=1 Tax=Hippocampus comes TaxID=109280 RepID=UPI00094E4A2F|nr:PREDICTED: deoxyribonuclease-2-beta [Hippocampus comes]